MNGSSSFYSVYCQVRAWYSRDGFLGSSNKQQEERRPFFRHGVSDTERLRIQRAELALGASRRTSGRALVGASWSHLDNVLNAANCGELCLLVMARFREHRLDGLTVSCGNHSIVLAGPSRIGTQVSARAILREPIRTLDDRFVILDPWAGIFCSAIDFSQVFESRMREWKLAHQRIRLARGNVRADDADWIAGVLTGTTRVLDSSHLCVTAASTERGKGKGATTPISPREHWRSLHDKRAEETYGCAATEVSS